MSSKVSLTLLSKLRQETSLPLSKARSALLKANNDYDSAKKMLLASIKPPEASSLPQTNGLISISNKRAVKLSCVSDFVALSKEFQTLAQEIVNANSIKDKLSDLELFSKQTREHIAITESLEFSNCGIYVHGSGLDRVAGTGSIGCVVQFDTAPSSSEMQQFYNKVAQHCVACGTKEVQELKEQEWFFGGTFSEALHGARGKFGDFDVVGISRLEVGRGI